MVLMEKKVNKKAEENYTKKEIEKIIERNNQLEHEVASLNKIVKSRRFQFADKIGNLYNRVVPEHTIRRRVARGLYAPVRYVSNRKHTVKFRTMQKMASNYSRVIVMHSIPWNVSLKQRPHHLAARLAEHDLFMIYLEPDEALTSFRKISDNFVTINSLETALKIPKKSNTRYYFFFNNVSNIPLSTIEKIKSNGFEIVYEYIDEFHEDISGTITNQLDVWNNLKNIKPAVVLASADKLYDDAIKNYRKDRVLLSKNAVNISDFDFHNYKDIEIPSDMKKILLKNHKIVGYYGAISPWLNYDLIHETAKSNPDMEFVFIGSNYQNSLQKLDISIKNIHFLGPKDYRKLPYYSSLFDCAIIPFSYGEIAKGTSPVKLFEYMAMGLPTVCTRDLLECYGYENVLISKDNNEFSKNICNAVRIKEDEQAREKLLEQARNNSWHSRANDIVDYLDLYEK